MNRRLSGLTLSLLAVALAGCSMLPDSRKIEYKSAGKAPTLETPPDLVAPARDDRFAVPDGGGKGRATFSAYANERTPEARAAKGSDVLPNVEKARIERSGSQRWLVVAGTPDKAWDTVKEFWLENGLLIKIEQPEAGVIETDWAENRAKLPQDFIRATIGKVFEKARATAPCWPGNAAGWARWPLRTSPSPGPTPKRSAPPCSTESASSVSGH